MGWIRRSNISIQSIWNRKKGMDTPLSMLKRNTRLLKDLRLCVGGSCMLCSWHGLGGVGW